MIVHGPYPVDPRVAREAAAAIQDGWEVEVIAARERGQARVEEVEGACVYRLPVSHSKARSAARVGIEYPMFTLLAALKVGGLHLRRRYDVVQVHNPPDFLIAAGVIPRLSGARVLLDIHDLSSDMLSMRFGAANWSGLMCRAMVAIERWSCAYADAVITVHAAYRDQLAQRGTPPERIVVVMNSLDESLLPSDLPRPRHDGAFRVVYHGTIGPQYGVDVLVDAVALAAASIPDIQLEIYGQGDRVDATRRRIRERGIESITVLPGVSLPQREVLQRIAGASVGVIPNTPIPLNRFALSTKLFEYVALGIPAVVSALPTMRQHFSGDEALFFEAGNVQALTEALTSVAADRSEAAERASRATARYERYRWGVQQQRYLDVLDGLVAEAGCDKAVRIAEEDAPEDSHNDLRPWLQGSTDT